MAPGIECWPSCWVPPMPPASWIGRWPSIRPSLARISTPPTSPATQGAGSNYTNLHIEPPDHGIGRSRGGWTTKSTTWSTVPVDPWSCWSHPAKPTMPRSSSTCWPTCAFPDLAALRPVPDPIASAPTRPTPVEISAPTCASAGSPRSSRSPQTKSPTVPDADPAADAHRGSTPRTTSAATSSNAVSTSSSNGAD